MYLCVCVPTTTLERSDLCTWILARCYILTLSRLSSTITVIDQSSRSQEEQRNRRRQTSPPVLPPGDAFASPVMSKQKYITYCIVVRGIRTMDTETSSSLEMWFLRYMRADRHRDRQTYRCVHRNSSQFCRGRSKMSLKWSVRPQGIRISGCNLFIRDFNLFVCNTINALRD